MAVTRKNMGINVLEAANMRLKNIFANGLKVYLDCSGGKDSIVLMSLVYELIRQGEIDPKQLEVVFNDEEVIYDDVIRVCKEWRTKFMLAGAKYTWYCIEHRNNNCFNMLQNNENIIYWDRYEVENWAHKPPAFATQHSPFHVPRVESYQQFFARSQRDGIAIIGVRASESLDRMTYISKINSNKTAMTGGNVMYPLYDWTDSDIWKYIKDNNIDFPEVYLRMYEAGIPKNKLRVSSLFAVDSCQSLNYMFEVYPDMWEKILKREPNAYLVRLYWDSEMFKRNTARKRKIEEENHIIDTTDYRAKLIEVVNHPKKYFKNPHALHLCEQYRNVILRYTFEASPENYKRMYNSLMAGDTKGRSLRACMKDIQTDYNHSVSGKHFTKLKGR